MTDVDIECMLCTEIEQKFFIREKTKQKIATEYY
jgi:hypothetical protein